MTQKLILIIVGAVLFFLIDLYVFQAVKVVTQGLSPVFKKVIIYGYWTVLVITLISFFYYHFGGVTDGNKHLRTYLMSGIFVNYFSKTFALLFVLLSDVVRGGQWVMQKVVALFSTSPEIVDQAAAISRSEFLAQTSLVVAAVPFTAMSYGILKGAHNYKVRYETLYLPDLPKAFDGIKIAQLSDIHSGSFTNKVAVKGGVDKLLSEKPDVVFFTGDLVNYAANEMQDYMNVFNKVKAPLGVYSTMGNHDYGSYYRWESQADKDRNDADFKRVHGNLGWDLLNNENRLLTVNGESIAVVGVENWGKTDWSQKFGQLDKAAAGTEEAPVRILLSHDPSHWEAQVLPHEKKFDLTLSGHTHGFQFGLEIGDFKWSPVQYIYKQWAGLYNKGDEHLYVNRGYGYLGFPGRIGMPPEITVITLKTKTA